jgi:putative phosphoribosyl transferase
MKDVRDVAISVGRIHLKGTVTIPPHARGIVLFAHGSGSSRHSPRNVLVAAALHEVGIATLLFDLLTEQEAADRRNVFDIVLLADRLRGARAFVRSEEPATTLPIGYFGASTGAAAALVAAAGDPDIRAVVSRGGRPDLAADALPHVSAPTLLIVGGEDFGVIELNQDAYARMRCEKRLAIVPGATHLFEEPGALEEVVRLASEWFLGHFAAVGRGASEGGAGRADR